MSLEAHVNNALEHTERKIQFLNQETDKKPLSSVKEDKLLVETSDSREEGQIKKQQRREHFSDSAIDLTKQNINNRRKRLKEKLRRQEKC